MEQHGPALADWGEQDSDLERRSLTAGDWSFDATGHGLESIGYRGQRVATRVFFSVRDLAWGSPGVRLRYSGDLGEPAGLAITGSVDGLPLEVTGSATVVGDTLALRFRVRALETVDVSRAGPCVLHERDDLAPGFTASGPDGTVGITLAERIVIERIATRYDRLRLSPGSLRLELGFTGELFEMEDQRNWGDSTFKSYCPPLADPQPITLRAGEPRDYAVTLTAKGGAAATGRSAPPTLTDLAGPFPMPRLGLRHSGGVLDPGVAAAIAGVHPAYLHLLADLASPSWREDLVADLDAAAQVSADAVISVDAAATDGEELAELARIARGRASTLLFFDRGRSTTSDELASAAGGAGIRPGGGSRSNFASLNTVHRVPAELEVVAVPLAVASHDDDRRALTTSLDSFAAIVRDTRAIAGGRELLVGPVGFRPTFDSWGPPGVVHDPRPDWTTTSRRDGTRFAAAWVVAAVGALTACAVPRITIGSTADAGSPAFEAFRELAALRDRSVWAVEAGQRVRGLRSEDELVLGVMTDQRSRIDYGARVLQLASPRVFHHSLNEPTTA